MTPSMAAALDARGNFRALARMWREDGPEGVRLLVEAEDRDQIELMLMLLVGREAAL